MAISYEFTSMHLAMVSKRGHNQTHFLSWPTVLSISLASQLAIEIILQLLTSSFLLLTGTGYYLLAKGNCHFPGIVFF